MKIITFILLFLLFFQSYYFTKKYKENEILLRKYDETTLAVEYYRDKYLEIIEQANLLENRLKEIEATQSAQELDRAELININSQYLNSINSLKDKNSSQEILLNQKDNEIMLLKNELLKFYEK